MFGEAAGFAQLPLRQMFPADADATVVQASPTVRTTARKSDAPICVMKFGGASMATAESIRVQARRVIDAERSGFRPVVVVSAMAGDTDRLLSLGKQASAIAEAAELDVLAAAGEQISAALFAISLSSEGRAARSFLAHQLPIRTDRRHGDATIRQIDSAALLACVDGGQIPVIAGFQGIDDDARITTLGRGGSDTTAVAIAAALRARECVFFKDVEGVFSADPKLCPAARKLDVIAVRHMLALSRLGAKVLHWKSVALALDNRIELHVRSGFGPAEGTRIVPCDRGALPTRHDAISISVQRSAGHCTVSVIGDALPACPGLHVSALAQLQTQGIAVHASRCAESAVSFDIDERAATEAVRLLHAWWIEPAPLDATGLCRTAGSSAPQRSFVAPYQIREHA